MRTRYTWGVTIPNIRGNLAFPKEGPQKLASIKAQRIPVGPKVEGLVSTALIGSAQAAREVHRQGPTCSTAWVSWDAELGEDSAGYLAQKAGQV